ncbi:hypothetical protein LTR66_000715 [Elasticomyces elasticus]|nr:hypothetical protein LTR66_000715 [Elasticomyces elasticus]
MADAFQKMLRDLPDELTDLLTDHVSLFQLPLVRSLVGRPKDLANFSSWNDCIFQRLGELLGSRQEATAEYTVQENDAGYRRQLFFIAGYAALLGFLQSNVTGPQLSYSSANTVLPPELVNDAQGLASLRQALLSSLTIDGVAAYRLTPYIELLCFADAVMTCPPILKNISAARWAKMRVAFVHQRLLSEVSPTLQKVIYEDLRLLELQVFGDDDFVGLDKQSQVEFLLERAAIHTYYGFDKKARIDLEKAKEINDFDFALTGILGKRTKYQENDISQLVVLAKSASGEQESNGDTSERHGNGSNTGTNNTLNGITGPSSGPTNLDLNDDTLLEAISFSEKSKSATDIQDSSSLSARLATLDPGSQPLLHPLDSIILLSLASSITNTNPADGLTREETLPYATRVLDGGSSNWQVYTQALLVRSRIEGYKSRTIERGLLQLQALVDQVIADTASPSAGEIAPATSTFLPKAKESESAPAPERLRYIFQLASPFRWDLEAELAARWVQLGGLRSALDIYERLEMWAEAALCWAATEREDKARRVVRRQLFHATEKASETEGPANDDEENWEGPARDPPPADAPRLYCILGDIDRDPDWYETAWAVSNERYARAQRSLGRHWFAAKDMVKAASAYSKSLKVNQLNYQSWFALGCALLELAQFERAVEAFSRCIMQDESNAEAWSNLAAALLKVEGVVGVTIDDSSVAVADDEDTEGVASSTAIDPQKNRKDALMALKRAASLKYDSHRIWENLLIIAASLSPPDYTSILSAQRHIIELHSPSIGEKCIDVEILDLLVRHIMLSSDGFDPSKPGLARMVVETVDKQIVPLITASRPLWQLVGRLALWRNKPSAALDAHEKAWRAVTTQPGWETESESRWNEVVDATIELCDAYESLGPRERTEGLGAGQLVAKDWKFKARSAIRGIMGKGKGSWEGTEGWVRLRDALDQLKG